MFTYSRLVENIEEIQEYEGINAQEVAEKLAALNAFGRTSEGGFTRAPLTPEERGAVRQFISWAKDLGLLVWEDHVGNVFAKWEGSNPALPVVMTGSHLDTVPNGGAFDGALGCLSSLLAIKRLQRLGFQPERSIVLVVFLDEEGSRFGHGLFGSQAIMGEVEPERLKEFVDDQGVDMYSALEQLGYHPSKVEKSIWNPAQIHSFLELHIEQGKKLERAGAPIGVVSGIAGPAWVNVTFLGQTDHAGNTPMTDRADAMVAAAEWIVEVEKLPAIHSDTAVATVGKIQAFPNGTNVVAGKVSADVDVRDIGKEARDTLLEDIVGAAHKIARKRGLTVEVKPGIKVDPVPVPQDLQDAIHDIAKSYELRSITLPSGAGHDMMNLGKYTRGAMVFVPSKNGKSHSPEEWTELGDCVKGILVLAELVKIEAS